MAVSIAGVLNVASAWLFSGAGSSAPGHRVVGDRRQEVCVAPGGLHTSSRALCRAAPRPGAASGCRVRRRSVPASRSCSCLSQTWSRSPSRGIRWELPHAVVRSTRTNRPACFAQRITLGCTPFRMLTTTARPASSSVSSARSAGDQPSRLAGVHHRFASISRRPPATFSRVPARRRGRNGAP